MAAGPEMARFFFRESTASRPAEGYLEAKGGQLGPDDPTLRASYWCVTNGKGTGHIWKQVEKLNGIRILIPSSGSSGNQLA